MHQYTQGSALGVPGRPWCLLLLLGDYRLQNSLFLFLKIGFLRNKEPALISCLCKAHEPLQVSIFTLSIDLHLTALTSLTFPKILTILQSRVGRKCLFFHKCHHHQGSKLTVVQLSQTTKTINEAANLC